jgi:hypothetical protein
VVSEEPKSEEQKQQEFAEAYVALELLAMRHNARIKARPQMKGTLLFMLGSIVLCLGIVAMTVTPWWEVIVFLPTLLLAFALGLLLERYWGEV